MTHSTDLINSLNSLPCIENTLGIDFLDTGLSQTAIKVTTESTVLFAKKLNNSTASSEIVSALICSNAALASTKRASLAPEVIYHDKEWLITKYIDGVTLIDAALNQAEKTTIALKLMARLHQLSNTMPSSAIATLDTRHAIDCVLPDPTSSLAKYSHILAEVTLYLTSTIEQLTESSKSQGVICHGDLNFSNILLESNEIAWLVDFECTHHAPMEFDLAMFIAVNNISTDNLDRLVVTYLEYCPNVKVHSQLLNHYILYSYFINGLWYFNNKNTKLAKEQWAAFDAFTHTSAINLPKLLSLVPR